MKNKVSAVAIAAVLASIAMASQVNAATTTVSGGNIHFTGEVVTAACAVDTGSADQTVVLGQVRNTKLATKGAVSNQKQFFIKLKDCDTSVSATASVAVNGTADANDNSALAVSGLTTQGVVATNVGIQILDAAAKVITPNTGTAGASSVLIDGSSSIPLYAQFIATADGATAGAADADATFNIAYN